MGLPYCHVHLKYKHHLRIKKSLIPDSGDGVFVINPKKDDNEVIFKSGAIICMYEGKVMTVEELEDIYGDYNAPYGVLLNNHEVENADIHRGVGAMINHKNNKQQVNCRISVNRQNRAQIVATKNIKNNAELYLHYGDAYKFNEEGVITKTDNKKNG